MRNLGGGSKIKFGHPPSKKNKIYAYCKEFFSLFLFLSSVSFKQVRVSSEAAMNNALHDIALYIHDCLLLQPISILCTCSDLNNGSIVQNFPT